MTHNSVLAIIPARGGSKGVPRKNVRALSGKPLIAYSIEQAKTARSVTRVVVSTDDKEIAAVALRYGAEVVWRPAMLSGDGASSETALIHVLKTLARREKYAPELVVFLQATSPCRYPGDIDGAVKLLSDRNADSCFSAYPQHFAGRWRIGSAGRVLPVNYKPGKRPMRQHYPVEYLENGSIYAVRTRILLKTGARIGGKIVIYPMPMRRSMQIDTVEDFELMESLLMDRRELQGAPGLADIRLLGLDFDGVMTDNRVLVDQNGREAVLCDRGDGLGLAAMRKSGIETVVISTEKNPVVSARCRKLRLRCFQGCADKLQVLRRLARSKSLAASQVAFVGNDRNDMLCMKWAGCPIAVADATPEIKRTACYITRHKGGRGAVREVIDRLLAALRTRSSTTADR